MKGSKQNWYMDNTCSRQMTGDRTKFVSLEEKNGRLVAYGGGKKGQIKCIGEIRMTREFLIKKVYHVEGMKHNLLSISQLCDKENMVIFHSTGVEVIDLTTGVTVLIRQRNKHVYAVDTSNTPIEKLMCLSLMEKDPLLWHKQLGHASQVQLNKLISENLVIGLLKTKFKSVKVCEACTRGKQVKFSFKSNQVISTTKSLELIHMDLCVPMRVKSRGGKRYAFVLVDNYPRYTWIMFLTSKDDMFEDFCSLIRKFERKLENKLVAIRSDHGNEFEHSKFIQFCSSKGIEHNFSALRTPQQNGVVERKNKTLQEMARTMMLGNNITNQFCLRQ